MPIAARGHVAAAIHEALVARLERGFGRVTVDVALPDTRHPTASVDVAAAT